jgi:hypothetical protein
VVVFFGACQKSGVDENNFGNSSGDSTSSGNNTTGSSTYYIKASMDGVAKTFNVSAMGIESNLAGITMLDITGLASSASSLESLGITINNSGNSKPIVAGSYSELETDGFVVAAVYNPGSTTIVYGAGLYLDTINPLKVTITSIDSKTVKGTFSGNLYYTNTTTDSVGPGKKTVTNGEFNVKF